MDGVDNRMPRPQLDRPQRAFWPPEISPSRRHALIGRLLLTWTTPASPDHPPIDPATVILTDDDGCHRRGYGFMVALGRRPAFPSARLRPAITVAWLPVYDRGAYPVLLHRAGRLAADAERRWRYGPRNTAAAGARVRIAA